MRRIMKKASFPVLVLILVFSICVAALAEETAFRPGDWAFDYAPEQSVLLLREDGTAVYEGQECRWTDDGTFLRLTAEGGEETAIRYLVTEKKTILYFPKVYVRVENDPGEGLIGAWVGRETKGSTFIFRKDGMFLEDGTFTGTFRTDPEAGTFLLVYIKYFDDTLCYYRMEGNDVLTVDYPWPMVERQETP